MQNDTFINLACATQSPQRKGGAVASAAVATPQLLLMPEPARGLPSDGRTSRRHSSDGVSWTSAVAQRGAAPPLACYSPMDVLELDNRRLKRQVSKLKLSLALTEADKHEREDAGKERRLAVPSLSSLLDLDDELDLSGLDVCLEHLEDGLPAAPPVLDEPRSPDAPLSAMLGEPLSAALVESPPLPLPAALAEPRSPILAAPRPSELAERHSVVLTEQRRSSATERKSPVELASPGGAQRHLRCSRGDEPRSSLHSAPSSDIDWELNEVGSPLSPQAQRAESDLKPQLARAQKAAAARAQAHAEATAQAAAAAAAAAEEEQLAARLIDSKWAALYRELVTSESFRLVGSGESCLDKLSHGCRRDVVLRYCDILDAIRRQAAREH